MKPIIKKSDLRSINKRHAPQSPPPPVVPTDDIDEPQPTVDAVNPPIQEQPNSPPQTSATESYPRHTPVADYPIVGSVGKSGWQVSDIWRDLRIDAFCD